jgi:hypothetical protein
MQEAGDPWAFDIPASLGKFPARFQQGALTGSSPEGSLVQQPGVLFSRARGKFNSFVGHGLPPHTPDQ